MSPGFVLPGAAKTVDSAIIALQAARAEQAWYVGGAVRDVLLGRAVRDLDVAVAGDARLRA